MARQEVYTTVIKLNSEEAKNRLKELEDRVARLKKAKQEAFSAGDSRLGASLAKDLKAAEREMKQFKNSTMSVKETLDNLSSASLGQLEKAARHLKGQMKAASDPSDFAKLDAQLSKVKEQMLALKGATRKADEEARRMTATVSNLKHASLNDLNFTASKLRSQMADYDPTSTMYASRASQLKLVEAELERIRQSEQKVVTLIQQYDKEIDRTNVDIKETKRQMQLVNNTMSNLKTSSIRDLEYSIKALNQQMHGMERGTEQFKQMELKAKQLKAELQAVRAEGVAQESWIKRSADWFNRMQGLAIGAVAAISGITFTVKKCVEEYAKMDDEMTNVRKYTGQAAEEVERMNEDFKKMDTRTPRQKLNQLAEDAGRLGITSTAAVEEFVDGADKSMSHSVMTSAIKQSLKSVNSHRCSAKTRPKVCEVPCWRQVLQSTNWLKILLPLPVISLTSLPVWQVSASRQALHRLRLWVSHQFSTKTCSKTRLLQPQFRTSSLRCSRTHQSLQRLLDSMSRTSPRL